jgi:hypothetical protein
MVTEKVLMKSLIFTAKAEQFSQIQDALKNLTVWKVNVDFFCHFLPFSAIVWSQDNKLLKKCRLTTPEIAQKKFQWAIFVGAGRVDFKHL